MIAGALYCAGEGVDAVHQMHAAALQRLSLVTNSTGAAPSRVEAPAAAGRRP